MNLNSVVKRVIKYVFVCTIALWVFATILAFWTCVCMNFKLRQSVMIPVPTNDIYLKSKKASNPKSCLLATFVHKVTPDSSMATPFELACF